MLEENVREDRHRLVSNQTSDISVPVACYHPSPCSARAQNSKPLSLRHQIPVFIFWERAEIQADYMVYRAAVIFSARSTGIASSI